MNSANPLHSGPILFSAMIALAFLVAPDPAFAGGKSRAGLSLSFGTGHYGGRHYGGFHHGLHDRHRGLPHSRHYGVYPHGITRHHYGYRGGLHSTYLDNDLCLPRTRSYYRYRYSPDPLVRHYLYERPNRAVLIVPPTRSTTTVYSTTRTRIPALDGWTYLGGEDCRSREALDAFAAEAERAPGRGLPRIGYALSQAMEGDGEKAAWAMRRAVAVQPESLREVEPDRRLRARINELASQYDQRVREEFSRSDDLFMIAALRYIQGEYAAAYPIIRSAIEQGDAEPTTRALKELIDAEYQRE